MKEKEIDKIYALIESGEYAKSLELIKKYWKKMKKILMQKSF